MKSVIADYRYRCHGLRIECTNGLVVRLTDYPRDIVMGGNTYKSDSGYQFTGIQTSTGMAAGAMDLEGIAAAGGITRDQVASGVFDNARLYCFATSWRAPVEDQEPLGAATLGRTTVEDDRYRIEMMMLVDALGQTVGRTTTPGCDLDFGSQWCGKNLADYTVAGTITHVTSQTVFRDAARTELEDWFGRGRIHFTSGPNVGLAPLEIKSYAADGTVTTFEPAYYPVEGGHDYVMVAGCRKRWKTDCRDKFDNVVNFGGFPAQPTSAQYQKVGGR